MPCEMFLTIQMHLTCRKKHVQSPTRKEGWDLFQRTSDDNSRKNPRWRIIWWYFQRNKEASETLQLCEIVEQHHWCRAFHYEEVAKNKGKESMNSRRMMSRMWYLQVPSCSRWKHRGIQGKIRSMRLLTERRHRLRRDILQPLEVKTHDKKTHVWKLKKALY